jgi:phosphoglycerol transferase MdoB-like AlkP superfamily enzyme
MNRRDGNVVAFLMELEYLEVDMPSGYSREEEKALLHANNPASVSAAMSDSVNLKRPNIIVIMNEAFSDPAVLLSKQSDPASGLPVNQDYMPYVHELMEGTTENTITGYANVSILGGNTANSEFEFLTGATMAFLPPGSVPYQQYVHDKMPSLASQLASLGYSTIALHPYNADGWERDRVYPLLGFQRFLSLNDMEYRHSIRNYLSDQACYSQIISLYEEKAAHTPLFTFAVTMQNHGGYTDKDPTLPVNVEVDLPHATTLNRYLSLILRSDNALERFIRYFEEEEEDTMIVFFGDHQPTSSVTNPVLQGNGIDLTSFSEENSVLKYKVPYLIWANFEIEDANAQETSLNYLALDILKNCNLPENAYQTILKEIREDYPIVSAMRAEDAQGQVVDISALEEYQQLQYYILFDES